MKNFFYLLCLLCLASCNDDLNLGDTEVVLPDETATETIETERGMVVFTDIVTDENNEALSEAVVSIYALGDRHSALTDDNGQYVLTVHESKFPKTGFISLSIHKDGYVPENIVYSAPLSYGDVLGAGEESSSLKSCPGCLNIGENSEELFHLGDDNFTGSENSQFQKSSDGVDVTLDVTGSVAYENLILTFEAKGLQPKHREDENHSSIQFMSGTEIVLEEYLREDSPEDGSFSQYVVNVDNRNPITSIKVMTRDRGTPGSDYDDWEFTNLHLRGR